MKVDLNLTPTELREAFEMYCKAKTGQELGVGTIVSAYSDGRVFVSISEYAFETYEVVKHRLV